MKDVTIVTFPFAGGNRYSYNFLSKMIPAGYRFQNYELPGRGTRIREPLLNAIEEVIDDAFNWINVNVNSPFVLYGHSMGALVAYLLLKRMETANMPLPLMLCVTGSIGPAARISSTPYHLLEKNAFLKKIKELGGCPPEILQDPAIMDFFEPILRSDFRIVEQYCYESAPISTIPFLCFYGLDEKATIEDVMKWELETSAGVEIRCLPGDHFFIHHFGEQILRELVQKTEQLKSLILK